MAAAAQLKPDSPGRGRAGLQCYNPQPGDPQGHCLGWGRREVISRGPYSQHPQLLEPRKVVFVDPSDVVPIEFPGEERRTKW